MNSWTLTTLGVPEQTDLFGVAADEQRATRAAVDALEAALIRHDGLGQRRYVITVDDHPPAILVTGRDHQYADPASLNAFTAAIRRAAAHRRIPRGR